MRAISAQRFLSSLSVTNRVHFVEHVNGQPVIHDPLVVLSPVCFLPAVIAYSRSLAKCVLGDKSESLLEVSTSKNDGSIFGISQNVSPLDSSVAGMLRTLLLSRGFELLCRDHGEASGHLPLEKLEEFFLTPAGQQYLIGSTDIAISLPDEMAHEILTQSRQEKSTVHG